MEGKDVPHIVNPPADSAIIKHIIYFTNTLLKQDSYFIKWALLQDTPFTDPLQPPWTADLWTENASNQLALKHFVLVTTEKKDYTVYWLYIYLIHNRVWINVWWSILLWSDKAEKSRDTMYKSVLKKCDAFLMWVKSFYIDLSLPV